MANFARALLPLIAVCVLLPGGSATAYTYKVLHSFCSENSCADGGIPMSGLAADAAGNLYGTTAGDPRWSVSTVYKLDPHGRRGKWRFTTLHSFIPYNADEGFSPMGVPILDAGGNIYGTNSQGGPNIGGTAFELIVNGDGSPPAFKLLTSFAVPHSIHGAYPDAGLTYQGAASGVPYDGVSPLYGTTYLGGHRPDDAGLVYRLVLLGDTWKREGLYKFCALASCEDGRRPYAPVLVDGGGNVTGVTLYGGSDDAGVVYKLADSGGGWNETVLHSFCAEPDCGDGHATMDGVIADALGNLLGVASGGPKQGGLMFKLEPDMTYSVLYRFCSIHGGCRDGGMPRGPLLMAASGTIFGATSYGGGNKGDHDRLGGGTLFAWDGSMLQTLHRFCFRHACKDGAYPNGGLIMDAQGNLFGTTRSGGENDAGVVFELSP